MLLSQGASCRTGKLEQPVDAVRPHQIAAHRQDLPSQIPISPGTILNVRWTHLLGTRVARFHMNNRQRSICSKVFPVGIPEDVLQRPSHHSHGIDTTRHGELPHDCLLLLVQIF